MVDDIEAEEEGIAEALLDNDTIAQSARPGTSLKSSATDQTPGQGLRYGLTYPKYDFFSPLQTESILYDFSLFITSFLKRNAKVFTTLVICVFFYLNFYLIKSY